ncbi:hypothetical protein F5Y17DRAFT_462660 [Xylariaceae sp. FL0594]|nr:hypothetical protein F5Y17DRAFT_462660 [Xylariaceae sp. FL0594]
MVDTHPLVLATPIVVQSSHTGTGCGDLEPDTTTFPPSGTADDNHDELSAGELRDLGEKEHGNKNEYIDKLMKYKGLKSLKQHFLQVEALVHGSGKEKISLKNECFNAVFPGIYGKLVDIARIYGDFLHSLKVFPHQEWVREELDIIPDARAPSSSWIKSRIKQMLEDSDRCGILIIKNNGFQPQMSSKERREWREIVTLLEDNMQRLAVVFVGFADIMSAVHSEAWKRISDLQHDGHCDKCHPVEFNNTPTDTRSFPSKTIQAILQYSLEYRIGDGPQFSLHEIDGFQKAKETPPVDEIHKKFGRIVPYVFDFQDAREDYIRHLFRKQLSKIPVSKHYPYRVYNKMKVEGGLEGSIVDQIINHILACHSSEASVNAKSLQLHIARYLHCALKRQSCRLKKEQCEGGNHDRYYLTQDDLILRKPEPSKEVNKLLGEITGLLGLNDVKKKITELVEGHYERTPDILPDSATLCDVFYGEEGTGRKTVAPNYGDIVAHLGGLSKDHEIYNACRYESEKTVNANLWSSRGRVLIVYDAHLLEEDKIDLLLEAQETQHDNRRIILIWDKYKGESLPTKVSRQHVFNFSKYTIDELKLIVKSKLNFLYPKVPYDDGSLNAAAQAQSQKGTRELDEMLRFATRSYKKRLSENLAGCSGREYRLEELDINIGVYGVSKSTDDILKGKVKEGVREQFEFLIMRLRAARDSSEVPSWFLFHGHRATGKVKVATALAGKFKRFEHIAENKVVELSVTDFAQNDAGELADDAKSKIQGAAGCLLFLDNALSLLNKPHSGQIVSELVKLNSQKKRTAVILADDEEGLGRVKKLKGLSRISFSDMLFRVIWSPNSC